MRDDKAHAHAHAAMRGDTAARSAAEQPRRRQRAPLRGKRQRTPLRCGCTRAVADKEDIVARVQQLQRARRRVRRCQRVCGENSTKKTCYAAAPW
jgi:hypothetical protein